MWNIIEDEIIDHKKKLEMKLAVDVKFSDEKNVFALKLLLFWGYIYYYVRVGHHSI